MINNYVGKRFGMLTVESIADAKTYKVGDSIRRLARYNVKCDCGNTTIVFGQDLRSKKTQSCGNHNTKYDDRSIPAFNAIVKGYYDSAIKRDLLFELSHNDCKVLFSAPCYYCGDLPYAIRSVKSGNTLSSYTYNGIDRIDNNKGYILDNVVSCCSKCNHAKHTMSQVEFLDLARKIVNRHG